MIVKKKKLTQPEFYLECPELEFWNHHFRKELYQWLKIHGYVCRDT